MTLNPIQQAGIDRARAMLAGLPDCSHATTAAILRQHGVDIDADDDAQPSVALARGQRRGSSIRLDAGVQVGTPLWQQVAVTGDFRGYRDGGFSFTPDTFARIVANFRASPQYGSACVVPWDVAHQSINPGNPPEAYAAVGWIRELDVRPAPQGAALWALTSWTDDMAARIRAGEFAYASVVVQFDAVDPRSGANVGPMLESVAVTNTPFITDLQRLAASRNGGSLAPSTKGNHMSATLSRAPDGSIRLAAPKAEIGPNVGHFADSAGDNPPLAYLPTLDGNRYQEILSAARTAGMTGATPETLASWLRSQGSDVERELATADPHRMAMIVGSILRQLASESQPVGANHEPGVAPIPTELSRAGAIDARPTVVAGRSPCERAIVALRAARGAGFTRLPWEDQCAIAAAEIRAGRVVAS